MQVLLTQIPFSKHFELHVSIVLISQFEPFHPDLQFLQNLSMQFSFREQSLSVQPLLNLHILKL
jgi:hypothetical protein